MEGASGEALNKNLHFLEQKTDNTDWKRSDKVGTLVNNNVSTNIS